MSRTSHITPGHVRAFQMITTQLYGDQITLASCWVNGEPGVAIVLVDEVGEDKVAVMPLFVAITPKMQIEMVGERAVESGGGGGGPRRANPDTAREFQANKAALTPGGGK